MEWQVLYEGEKTPSLGSKVVFIGLQKNLKKKVLILNM